MNIWFLILVLATPVPLYFAQSRPTLGQKVFLIFIGILIANILLNLALGSMWSEIIAEVNATAEPSAEQIAARDLAQVRKTTLMFGGWLPAGMLVGIWWLILKVARRASGQAA
ncbi:hypothetical protein [Aestuariispira insulae]|uniref:hypothetical protein n=1 Tax=Aestuariispira insulae TaxID=1461337 RepID=UPI0011C06DD9|nr:hypothetical protein [Aestuariispira insulae]